MKARLTVLSGPRRGDWQVLADPIIDLCHCTSCDATRRVKVLCLFTCGLVLAGAVLLGTALLRVTAEAERQVVA